MDSSGSCTYLSPALRPLARALWEEIFPEDSPAFLDAYEEIKAGNRIAAQKAGDRLAAMVQCNPFLIQDGPGRECLVHYIVGVATRPRFRHQGRMRELLRFVMRDMRAEGEPFTFLMPASEEIYLPFDFVTVTRQETWQGNSELSRILAAVSEPVPEEILGRTADRILSGQYDVFCRRTPSYLRNLEKELSSEDGRIIPLMRMKGEENAGKAGESEALAGYMAAWPAGEDSDGCFEIRELVAEESVKERLKPFLLIRERRPCIMIRLLSPETFLKPVRGRNTNVLLHLQDPFLEENTGWYFWRVREQGSEVEKISTTGLDQKEGRNPGLFVEDPGKHLFLVDNVENSVDISTENTLLPGPLGEFRGESVDQLWITTARELTAWRFSSGEPGTGPKGLFRAGRVFLNETV